MLLSAAFMLLLVLPACDKDDDHDNNDNIVQKNINQPYAETGTKIQKLRCA